MSYQQDIEKLISGTGSQKRSKQRYRKPRAIKDFEVEHKRWDYAKRNIPPQFQVLTKFRDDTANELTKLIVAFIRVNGGFATRLNSTGVYRADIKRFVRNTQRRGMADVVGTYQGRSLNIEVKIGRDSLSKHQKKIKHEIEASGGQYFVARDFQGFSMWFDEFSSEQYRYKT